MICKEQQEFFQLECLLLDFYSGNKKQNGSGYGRRLIEQYISKQCEAKDKRIQELETAIESFNKSEANLRDTIHHHIVEGNKHADGSFKRQMADEQRIESLSTELEEAKKREESLRTALEAIYKLADQSSAFFIPNSLLSHLKPFNLK